MIETIEQTVRWDITLAGYNLPLQSTSMLANICGNYLLQEQRAKSSGADASGNCCLDNKGLYGLIGSTDNKSLDDRDTPIVSTPWPWTADKKFLDPNDPSIRKFSTTQKAAAFLSLKSIGKLKTAQFFFRK